MFSATRGCHIWTEDIHCRLYFKHQTLPCSPHTTYIFFIIYIPFCVGMWIFPGWQNMLCCHHWATAWLIKLCQFLSAIFRSITAFPVILQHVTSFWPNLIKYVTMLTALYSSFSPVLFVAIHIYIYKNHNIVNMWIIRYTTQMLSNTFM